MFPIPPIDKPINTPCQFCTGKGCSIWSTKPKICTEYECAYYQADNIPKELRPDKCGIIFTKKSERIFSGVLVTGVKVSDLAKQQIQSFNDQGYAVILLSVDEKEPLILVGEGQNKEEIFKEYKEVISGNI
jgi:hypothetical protein